jgi:hypothetical protein
MKQLSMTPPIYWKPLTHYTSATLRSTTNAPSVSMSGLVRQPSCFIPRRPAVADDIVTSCEGSNDNNPHIDNDAAMCGMCGKWFYGTVVPAHDRMDILAMIKRGDFDA